MGNVAEKGDKSVMLWQRQGGGFMILYCNLCFCAKVFEISIIIKFIIPHIHEFKT